MDLSSLKFDFIKFYIYSLFILIFSHKQTTLSSGTGACSTTPGTISSIMYYCSPSTATPNNCNNFGPSPAGVGFKCWNPVSAASVTCSDSQWQCEVKNFFMLKSFECLI